MEIRIGKVVHFYNRIGVAVIELESQISVGDTILILGRNTEFAQPVESLEINHRKIASAGPNEEVALKVWDYVRKGDFVYKIVEEEQVSIQ